MPQRARATAINTSHRNGDADPRIAIIGGGCSGVTAAYKLYEKGYRSVTLYEADDRIGGKIHSVEVDGQVVEVGAVAFPKDNATMFELARDLDEVEIVQIKPRVAVVHKRRDRSLQKIRFDRYWGANSLLDVVRGLLAFRKVVWGPRFRDAFDPGFYKLDAELVSLTMADFARKHNFHSIVDPFYASKYAFGYGAMEEVPALYLLKMMRVLEKTMIRRRISFGRNSDLHACEGGNQTLWEKTAGALRDKGLDLRLGVAVNRIVRRTPENGGVEIAVTGGGRTDRYDRLFVASPPDKTLQFIDATREERDLLGRVSYFNYNTMIFRAEGLNKNEWLALRYNMMRNRQGHLFAYCNDARAPDLFVGYQFNDAMRSDKDLDALARRDVAELGGTVCEIVDRKAWKYFPHVKLDDLDAHYYPRLNALQGQRGTYHLGGLFAFESTEHCAQFARFIVNRFHEQEGHARNGHAN